MGRPGILCKLKKGLIIDAQSGFVDTFNWMVEALDNLTKNIEEVEVVVGSEYDTETHQFKNEMRKITVIKLDENTGSDKEVFTAVPLSEEE